MVATTVRPASEIPLSVFTTNSALLASKPLVG